MGIEKRTGRDQLDAMVSRVPQTSAQQGFGHELFLSRFSESESLLSGSFGRLGEVHDGIVYLY